MNAASRCARCVSGISFCGSFGAPSTTKSGVRVAGLATAAVAGFAAGLGFGAAGMGVTPGAVLGRPIGCTDVPKYGETSSGSPCSGYEVRSSVTVIVGAPVSFSFVPAAGDCRETLFAA